MSNKSKLEKIISAKTATSGKIKSTDRASENTAMGLKTPTGSSATSGTMSTTGLVTPIGSSAAGNMTTYSDETPTSGIFSKKTGSVAADTAPINKSDVVNSGVSSSNTDTRGDKYADAADTVFEKIVSGENEFYDNANSMQSAEYESKYDSQIQGLVDKILNGEKFDYNVNEDALFSNYADVYERSARKAAEDALGRAAAASGGYGSSYASAAASQAYNSQMQSLNEVVPQLQQLAYEQYLANRQDEYNQLGTLTGLEDSDYSRYRDSMSDYYTERDYQVGMGDRYNENLFNSAEYAQGIVEDEREQERWQAEYDAARIDSDRDYQLNVDQFEHDKDMDNKEYELDVDQFEHDKQMDINNSTFEEALAAAEYGDYSLLEWYTGADLSDAKKWDEIMKGAEFYSATGLVDFLKNAGVDTTQLEDNIADDEYAENLSIAMSVYEATGSPDMLNNLGIDTTYMDKILAYTLQEAENSANGTSGGSGGGSYYSSSTNYSSTPTLTQNDIDKGVDLILGTDGSAFDAYIESLEESGYSKDDIQLVVNTAYDKLFNTEGGLAFQGVLGTVLGVTDDATKLTNRNYSR